MRHYVIREPEGGRPYVWAECPDYSDAVDLRAGVVVREDGKKLGDTEMVTPERAEAIAAWKKGDDAAYIEDEIRWATKISAVVAPHPLRHQPAYQVGAASGYPRNPDGTARPDPEVRRGRPRGCPRPPRDLRSSGASRLAVEDETDVYSCQG
jgi:hypothetical protein